jgi:ABC-type multidrug transport system ATPase subunit
MKIILTNAAKRFNFEWVFKQLNYTFQSDKAYALTGSNGSGKTTLLRVLSGYSSLSDGSIEWLKDNDTAFPADSIFQKVAVCSPASSLIEELTLEEHLLFQAQFKPFLNNLRVDDVIAILQLEKHRHKLLAQFSTGMKQRVKLALAILADVEVLLLDEPSSNLDEAAISWMHLLLKEFVGKRLLLIASNDEADLVLCKERIHLNDYK